jgi:predicted transcriptional regulator
MKTGWKRQTRTFPISWLYKDKRRGDQSPLFFNMAEKFQYCDCCGQKMMVYRRGLRKGLILALIELWKRGPSKIANMDLTHGINADFSKMRFWGLIHKAGDQKKSNAVWEITEKGKDFLTGLIDVHKYIFIYNNEVQKISTERVKLIEIHHEKIDFETVLEDAEKYEDFIFRTRRLTHDQEKMPEMRKIQSNDQALKDRQSSTSIRMDVQGMPR